MTRKAAPDPAEVARSTPKRARPRRLGKVTAPGRGRPYPAEVREQAVADVERHGLADVAKRTGIPKGTLAGWVRAAGVDLGEQARARTATATAHVEAKAAELKRTTVDRLEAILERQLTALEARANLELLAEVLVAESDLSPTYGERGVTYEPADPEAAAAVIKLRLLAEANPKRDTVGAATRAVHDLALLKGEATERGTILVRFGIPRPDARAADAAAVDERDLATRPTS